jgi:hypothetical protein
MLLKRSVFMLGAIAALTAAAAPALAQTVAANSADDPVILSVTGRIKGAATADFNRADLERLPITIIRTATPWHDGAQIFEGVALTDLVAHLGASGRVLKVTALNAYRTEIPLEDAARHHPILAYRRNGAPMSVRDKGPLFVIYPYDADAALRTELYHSRSAWQVRSIAVE